MQQSTVSAPARKVGAAVQTSRSTARPRPNRKPAVGKKPAANDPVIHPGIHALARTTMMSDARAISAAAKELLDLLEAFTADHTRDSIVTEMRAAGFTSNEAYHFQIAEHLLYDATGGVYAVESFEAFFSSEVLRRDDGILVPAPHAR